MTHNTKLILQKINKMSNNTLMKTLNITYIKIGNDFLIAQMPVEPRVYQPMKFLHGGAILALAESVGSMLSFYTINQKKFRVFGLEISANYFYPKKTGIVFAKSCLIYKGKKTHFIQINVYDENKKFISQCKMTNIIIPNEKY